MRETAITICAARMALIMGLIARLRDEPLAAAFWESIFAQLWLRLPVWVTRHHKRLIQDPPKRMIARTGVLVHNERYLRLTPAVWRTN